MLIVICPYHHCVLLVRHKHHDRHRWEFQTHTKTHNLILGVIQEEALPLKDSWLLQLYILFQIVVFRQFSLFIHLEIDGSQSGGWCGINKCLHHCWFIKGQDKKQLGNKQLHVLSLQRHINEVTLGHFVRPRNVWWQKPVTQLWHSYK